MVGIQKLQKTVIVVYLTVVVLAKSLLVQIPEREMTMEFSEQ